MRRGFLLLGVVLGLGLSGAVAQARPVIIRLGTLAPRGSSWEQLLEEMGQRWKQASNGQVKLRVYPGGVAGDEGDMVRKMRIGQLQAAALTVVGLSSIDPAPQAIAAPGLIHNDAEWDYVFSRMTPVWGKELDAKGYVVLMWGDTGWVHMFFKHQITSPDQMKGMKVFAWSGDPSAVKAFRLAGFDPVVLSATDILPSLSTGMIQGYPATPIIALTAGWYEYTPWMTNAAWGHLPGATIVSKSTWEKIPADTRTALMKIAAQYGVKVNAEVERMQKQSIAVMKKKGLHVITFDAAGQAEWNAIARRTWPAVRGGVVSDAEFDQVKKLVDAYRAQHGG